MEHRHGFWQCVQCTQPLIGRKLVDTGITQRADTAITIQNIGQVNVQELLYSARYRFETWPGRIIFLPRFSLFPQSLRVNIAVLAQSRPLPPLSYFTQITVHHSTLRSLVHSFCGASTRLRVTVPPHGTSRSHSMDTPQSAGLLWTRDQLEAEVWRRA